MKKITNSIKMKILMLEKNKHTPWLVTKIVFYYEEESPTVLYKRKLSRYEWIIKER